MDNENQVAKTNESRTDLEKHCDPCDYDGFYANLGLKPGASMEAIHSAWKEQAVLAHPDNFSAAAQKEAAEKRLITLNSARDQLRDYWTSSKSAPPSAVEREALPKLGPSAQVAKSKLEELGFFQWRQEWKPQRLQRPELSDTGNVLTEETSTVPPVPALSSSSLPAWWHCPPVQKKPQYHFYDLANASSASGTISFIIALFFIGITTILSTRLIVEGIGLVLHIPFSFWLEGLGSTVLLAIWLWILIPLVRTWMADYDIYEIENNPYLNACELSAPEALARISQRLTHPSLFDGQKWTCMGYENDPLTKAVANDYGCKFSNNEVHLHTRAVPTESGSKVSYWFEIKSLPIWRTPMAHLLRQTDTALWKILGK